MKHRIINTKFWHDEYVQNLSIQKRYFYLYLFTNPHTEISGIYEISLKTMEFETLINSDSLSQSLKEFENDKKLIYQDNWIILKNFVKHQRPNPSILQGLKNAIAELPKEIYQKAQQNGIFNDSLSQSVDSLSHTPLYKVIESKIKENKIKVSEGVKSPAPPPKGNGSLTPAEEMRQFCVDGQKQQKVVDYLLGHGFSQDTAKNELTKFIDYWTEQTKSGRQQRWETEKTFEVKKRLSTWIKKYEQFNTK